MAKSTVAVRFTGDVSGLSRATGEAESKLKGFADKSAGILKAGLAAAGAAGAAALGKAFFDGLEQEKSADRVAASLGYSPDEAAQLGRIAGKLYADAYGESYAEVAETVGLVNQGLGELDESQLEALSAHALDFAAIFQTDVSEAVNAAGLLLRNGLVKDGEEAFDLLVAASQRMTPRTREELLEAVNEYSTFFADLGITGSEAFALISRAALKGGNYGVDKVGDALKELTIRATDMSSASVDAFKAAGLNAEDMAGRFVQGGDVARGALSDLITGLLGIEDPVVRSNAAIALFGTPLEDLSVTEIPAFLEQLAGMTGGLGDVEGAADEAGTMLNDNLGTDLEAFKRTAQQALVKFVEEEIVPRLQDFHRWLLENEDAANVLKGALVALAGAAVIAWFAGLSPLMLGLIVFTGFVAGATLATQWLIDKFDLLPKASKVFQVIIDYGVVPLIGALKTAYEWLQKLYRLMDTPKRAIFGEPFNLEDIAAQERAARGGRRLDGAAAAGGPVGPGTWLVGENGPELLHLGGGRGGYVTPNHRLGGPTVNVYVHGSVLSERDLVATINRAVSKGIR